MADLITGIQTSGGIKKYDYNALGNHPFYESITEIGTTTTDSSVAQSTVSFDIDSLAVGDNICYEVTCDGNTTKGSFILEDCVDMPKSAGNNYSYMWNDNGFISLIDVCDGTCDTRVRLYRLDDVKQLDEKFIPDRIKYTYVTDKKLGEAPAVEDMGTVFVICSEEIKAGDTILVKGYFSDGTTEEYALEVPELEEDYTKIGTADGRLGDINLPISTTVTFQCDVKGEVYKLNKKPISEATAELYGIVKEIDEALDRVIEKYGLGGFVMPEGAFAIIEDGMSISAGTYEFVAFIAEDGTVYEEIPEDGSIGGAVGSDIDNRSTYFIERNSNLIIENDGLKLFGYTNLSWPNNYDGVNGTTYIVRVGDAE